MFDIHSVETAANLAYGKMRNSPRSMQSVGSKNNDPEEIGMQ